MKFWKNTLLTITAFLGVAAMVFYTSCEKDSCVDLKCKNGGSCADDFCRCPTGYEGAECEIKIANRFLGTYYGYQHCGNNPSLLDTVEVYMKAEPNIVELYRHSTPNEKIDGTATDYDIVVPEQTVNNSTIDINVTLDVNKITLFEESVDAGGDKSVCNFIGLHSN